MRKLLAALLLCLVAPALASDVIVFFPNCKLLLPSADSSTSGWTASGGGTHFSMVQDPSNICGWGSVTNGVHDFEATYLTAASGCTTCSDVFDIADWSDCTGKNIRSVAMGAVARKAGAGAQSFKMYLRIGGVDYSVKTVSPSTTTYADNAMSTKVTTNPATSLPWTCSDINALQLKITRETGGTQDIRVTAAGIGVVYDLDDGTLPTGRVKEVGGD